MGDGKNMSEIEQLAVAIIAYLRSPAASASLTPDAAEGLVVAAQCLETSYGLNERAGMQPNVPNLLEIFRRHLVSGSSSTSTGPAPTATAFVAAAGTIPFPFTFGQAAGTSNNASATHASAPTGAVNPEAKSKAEALKNEGNTLMKAEKFAEALQKYTEAISFDSSNAIFFCNRAAAHSSLKNNEAAIEDCKKALALNPKYGRAYGRLGLALTNLNRHAEAREAYKIACQLEPQNEAYRNNLLVTEDTLRHGSQGFSSFGVDLGSILQNQALTSIATQMLSDPGLQNIVGRVLNDLGSGAQNTEGAQAPQGSGLNVLLHAGQQLAQQMQQANPELVEQLRQMTNNIQQPSQNPPPPPQPPKPPQ